MERVGTHQLDNLQLLQGKTNKVAKAALVIMTSAVFLFDKNINI